MTMKNTEELPKRKSVRLKEYDYSQDGYYFITICTENRRQILSHINVGQGLAPAENKLSDYGKTAEKELLALENRFPGTKIEKYVIMPNHIHAIIAVEACGETEAKADYTIPEIICAFKSLTTRECKRIRPIEKVFQNSYYDHIIRGEKDYTEIWEYIETNPARWREDKFFSQ